MAERNVRSLVIRYLQLPVTSRRALLKAIGVDRPDCGGEALTEVRERGLIDAFEAEVDRRNPLSQDVVR